MGMITVTALNSSHAKRLIKLDEHLGRDITIQKVITKRKAGTQLVLPQSDCTGEEYYLVYQFSSKETSVAGRFVGQFEIVFLDGTGTLIAPIREELFINVLDGSIKKS